MTLFEIYKANEDAKKRELQKFNNSLRTPDAVFKSDDTFGYWHLPEGSIARIRCMQNGSYDPDSTRIYTLEELAAIFIASSAVGKEAREE